MSYHLEWLYYLMLLMLSVAGLALNILGLPGLWLIVLSGIGYAVVTSFLFMGWPGVITLLVLALMGELVEFLAGSAGAKAAGASKRGMAGAVVGGLVGGIVGTPLIPIPVLGTIIGAVAGSFIGASVVEYVILQRTTGHSLRVGYGAAKGRLYGILSKSAIGLVMLLVAAVAAFPLSSGSPTPVLVPTTLPATLPTTVPAS
jgi:uncharacterized protein YqgC (DUF456 family)